jgi:8-oxo-dGTP pyrophosphatase MutT (NUDIX family)
MGWLEEVRRGLKAVEEVDKRVSRDRAAVMLIVTTGNIGPELLVLKRNEDPKDMWSGQICLPGGRVKEEDRDMKDTVLREVKEEAGFEIHPEQIIGVLDEISPANQPNLKVMPFVAYIDKKPKVRLGEEVVEAIWVPIRELRRSQVDPKKFGLRGDYAFYVKNRIIWGMTARVVKKFLDLFRIPS